MPELVQTIVDAIQAEGSIDLDDTAVLRVLDRRHKMMVARAESYRLSQNSVAADQAAADLGIFPAPADLVHLEHLLVATSATDVGVEYTSARFSDLEAAYGPHGIAIDGDGIYARWIVSTAEVIWIYPSVSLASQITVVGSYRPPTLVLGGTVYVDDEAVEGLMAGVFASLLARPGESRPDLASPHEEMFTAACEEYRRRARRRLSGGGVAQIRVQGVNA